MNKVKIYSFIGAVVVVLGISGFFLFTQRSSSPVVTESLAPTQTLTPSVSNQPKTTAKPQSAIPDPVSCNIGGTIKFSTLVNAQDNSYFSYTNIDNPANQIKWTITPNDALKVGPNIAAGISRPNGKAMVQVVLPQYPQSDHYTLNASVAYNRYINDETKDFESKCSGSIEVTGVPAGQQ